MNSKLVTSLATLLVSLAGSAALHATVVVTSSPGYNIGWDGNDGVHFDPNPPPAGAVVPDNLARASNGSVPFSSSDLGPELGIDFHVAANLNDGIYGNANSWISASADPGPAHAGVMLANRSFITSFAFGRDNGNGAFDDSAAGTDCCGGQLDDRTLGVYTIQITSDDGLNWTDVGTVQYTANIDVIPGGDFTSYFRHEYSISTAGGAPVEADGLRLIVPAIGVAGGTAVDEIEIYGSAVPEPSGVILVLVGLAGLLLGRRRG